MAISFKIVHRPCHRTAVPYPRTGGGGGNVGGSGSGVGVGVGVGGGTCGREGERGDGEQVVESEVGRWRARVRSMGSAHLHIDEGWAAARRRKSHSGTSLSKAGPRSASWCQLLPPAKDRQEHARARQQEKRWSPGHCDHTPSCPPQAKQIFADAQRGQRPANQRDESRAADTRVSSFSSRQQRVRLHVSCHVLLCRSGRCVINALRGAHGVG
jgi:hypothetical protein